MYKISAQSVLFLKSYRVNGRTHRPILECTHFLSTQKHLFFDKIFTIGLNVQIDLKKRKKNILSWMKYFGLIIMLELMVNII